MRKKVTPNIRWRWWTGHVVPDEPRLVISKIHPAVDLPARKFGIDLDFSFGPIFDDLRSVLNLGL
jgi:hypothetical protein